MTDQQAPPTTALRLTEAIAAPPETVFRFLVDPERMLRWMGTEVRIDPTPGGEYWVDVTGTDTAVGTYLEVDPPKRVVFTWGWQGSTDVPPGSSTVTITLEPDGDGTIVELVHEGLPGGDGDSHRGGWTHFLARLGSVVEGRDPGPNNPDGRARVVDPDTWRQARLEHLVEEKAFTKARDELSRKRRELPWTEVTEDYRLEGPDGTRSLAELFGDHGQLVVYHFMLGPGWGEGCPSCSFWADNYDGVGVHLAARDTAFATISRAPLEEIEAYRERMGWSFDWYSSAGTSFNYDMGVSFTPEQVADGKGHYNFGTIAAHGDEMPGISVFNRSADGRVFLSSQTFARGLDMLNGAYHLLDLTPKGRDEDQLDFSMGWLRRHDAY